jgi:ssDNA-binding Zn-finger/Zn-ribbon topoisomerase 1
MRLYALIDVVELNHSPFVLYRVRCPECGYVAEVAEFRAAQKIANDHDTHLHWGERHECPQCGRLMSEREYREQKICNDCESYLPFSYEAPNH